MSAPNDQTPKRLPQPQHPATRALRAWTTAARRLVYDRGHRLRVEEHELHLPDGSVIPDWLWLAMPSFVLVIPQTQDGRFLVMRQVKYAAQGVTLAPIAGVIDPGEEPLAAAQRELLEESGHRADSWQALGGYPSLANRGAGVGHIFLARGAAPVPGHERLPSDDLEDQELLWLTEAELRAAHRAGEFQVMSWTAAVGLALAHLDP